MILQHSIMVQLRKYLLSRKKYANDSTSPEVEYLSLSDSLYIFLLLNFLAIIKYKLKGNKMSLKIRNAFTMLELTFVIVVIGILSAVAIPKFAMTRDDAVVSKAKATVAAVRNAVSTERQKRILRGKFNKIFKLSSNNGYDQPIFNAFDGNTSNPVLEYPLQSCKNATAQGCWKETTTGTQASPTSEYTYKMPVSGSVIFQLKNNRFDCKDLTNTYCIELTR